MLFIMLAIAGIIAINSARFNHNTISVELKYGHRTDVDSNPLDSCPIVGQPVPSCLLTRTQYSEF